LHEKTLLVGVRELTRGIDFFFNRFIMSCMQASLEEFKIKWGYWVLTSIQNFFFNAIKNSPPLKPK